MATGGSSLKVAIAGFGWFGRLHADTWLSVPGVEIVALADPRFAEEDQSASFSQSSFHQDVPHEQKEDRLAKVPRFPNVEALLAEHHPDLVDVVTDEPAHAATAHRCLEAGAHVAVEKPVALSAAEIEAFAGAAKSADRHVYPGHVLRFDPRFSAIHSRASRGGKISHISTQRHFQRRAQEVYGRIHPAFNALIHDLDVALWLASEPPHRLRAYQHGRGSHGAPSFLSAILEWRDGMTASLETGWNLVDGMSAGYEFRCTVFHEEFTAIAAPAPDLALHESEGEARFPDVHLWPALDFGVAGALRNELTHFALCAAADRPSSVVSLDDAAAVVALASAVVEAADSEEWIEL